MTTTRADYSNDRWVKEVRINHSMIDFKWWYHLINDNKRELEWQTWSGVPVINRRWFELKMRTTLDNNDCSFLIRWASSIIKYLQLKLFSFGFSRYAISYDVTMTSNLPGWILFFCSSFSPINQKDHLDWYWRITNSFFFGSVEFAHRDRGTPLCKLFAPIIKRGFGANH